jgi:hypothetical protein
MKPINLSVFFMLLSASSPLWALPAVVENINYKVTLSETLPGMDDQTNLQAPPTITVDVQDKIHSTDTRYPLNVYSINHYYLADDTLNLLCRINRRAPDSGPRYTLIQLNLSSPSDSRQFQPVKQYSFSPDDQTAIAVLDGAPSGGPDSVGVIRLNHAPAQLGWIYANKGLINLFQKALPDISKDVVIQDPVGWSADSLTAVFVVSASSATPDSQATPMATPVQPASKDYLASVELTDDGYKVAAQPVDLSPYHYRNGGVIYKIECSADKATIYFSQANSSDNLQAVFSLPKPAN